MYQKIKSVPGMVVIVKSWQLIVLSDVDSVMWKSGFVVSDEVLLTAGNNKGSVILKHNCPHRRFSFQARSPTINENRIKLDDWSGNITSLIRNKYGGEMKM